MRETKISCDDCGFPIDSSLNVHEVEGLDLCDRCWAKRQEQDLS